MSVSSQGSHQRKADLSPTSPTIKISPAQANITSEIGLQRTNLKVSFKDRIKNIQKDDRHDGSAESLEAKQHLLPSTSSAVTGVAASSSTKPKKPSTTKQLKEKIKSLGHIQKDELTPWSKLKRATVVGLGGSYTSLSNNLNEDSPKLTKTPMKTSMPVNLNIISNKLNDSTPLKLLHHTPFQSTSHHHPPQLPSSSVNEFVVNEQKTSISDSELKCTVTDESSSSIVKIKSKPKPPLNSNEPKSYRSVDDLSPEYSGLPFVKKLKILYERQKLAELESAIQTTRSLSLDYTDSSTSSDIVEVLTRSQSEASCMIRSRGNAPIAASLVPVAPLNFNMHLIPMSKKSPLSPESNETLERKNLKSILKKLSEDRLSQNVACAKGSNSGAGDRQEMKRLMRAQTLEGYVARRTKFTKSVTFNHTLSSPPSATLTEEPEESPIMISPQYPPVFSPILSTQQQQTAPYEAPALYPIIANAQNNDNISRKIALSMQVDSSTNKFTFTDSSIHNEDSKLLTSSNVQKMENLSQQPTKLPSPPPQPQLCNNNNNNNFSNSDITSSETLAFHVSDNFGERKIVKGIFD